MNIDQMSVTELKALVYDELVKVEQAKQNLQILNARIAELSKPAEEAPAAA